jgi:hypothetical protein
VGSRVGVGNETSKGALNSQKNETKLQPQWSLEGTPEEFYQSYLNITFNRNIYS